MQISVRSRTDNLTPIHNIKYQPRPIYETDCAPA